MTAAKIGKKCKTLLLITSSGGGGHMQAAKARADKAKADDPSMQIIQQDILTDWVGKRCGRLLIYMWNLSQKKGKVALLHFFSKFMPIADLLFWPRIFFKALVTVIRKDIDHIIDTQPIGTLATVKALKMVRYLTGKTVLVEKVLTELPTKQVFHFFKPIKRLSYSDRAFLRLVSHRPLLGLGETPNAFWMKHCGLRERDIRYANFPLRAAFTSCVTQSKPLGRTKIKVKASSHSEIDLIVKTIQLGSARKQVDRESVTVIIEPEDKVVTMMLGSQPTEKATVQYIKHFIELFRKVGNRGYCHFLFVFCQYDAYRPTSLLHRVHYAACTAKNYPKHFNIIPMCFQEDQVIATLYSRSDATLTRSGGLTSMELMSVAQGKIWIHSEAETPFERDRPNYYGMPVWEWGNARYLEEKKGAELITPNTFFDRCGPFFMCKPASAHHADM